MTNLCWRLTEVLRGSAGDALLDSYETERSQHVHTLTSRIKAIGHHICERDPTAARVRDEALLLQGGGEAPTVTRQEIVPPLEAGLLAKTRHPANGTIFPQPWILTADGPVHMDVITGHGWRLIVNGDVDVGQVFAEFANESMMLVNVGGVGYKEQDGILAKWFAKHDCIAAIVRPDHYVYGAAKTVEELKTLAGGLYAARYGPAQLARSTVFDVTTS